MVGAERELNFFHPESATDNAQDQLIKTFQHVKSQSKQIICN